MAVAEFWRVADSRACRGRPHSCPRFPPVRMGLEIAIEYWMMKSMLRLAVFAIAAVAGLRAIAEPPTFRDIRVHVVDIHGKLAANRKVDLVGLERWGLEPSADGAVKFWHFVTTKNGDVTIPIGDFAGWTGNEVRPGWGVYAAVVEAGDEDAGGVSSRFWFDNASTHRYDPTTEGWAPEWGTILPVPPTGLNLTISVQEGFTLKGRVVDDQHPEIPLAGVEIDTNNDLHADTHTGMGGTILGGEADTDANGNFMISHQFPNILYVDIQPTIWLKTRINGKWENQVGSVIRPPTSGTVVNLEIGASRVPRFKYYGRVIDSMGQPVANAQVSLSFMIHSDRGSETWEDEHNSQQTTTRADGKYEFVSPTPWMNWIRVETSNHSSGFYEKASDNQILPPGEYDITTHD